MTSGTERDEDAPTSESSAAAASTQAPRAAPLAQPSQAAPDEAGRSDAAAQAQTQEQESSFFDDDYADEGEDPYERFVSGHSKGKVVQKMRANREAGAGKKLNKPLHRDKRSP